MGATAIDDVMLGERLGFASALHRLSDWFFDTRPLQRPNMASLSFHETAKEREKNTKQIDSSNGSVERIVRRSISIR